MLIAITRWLQLGSLTTAAATQTLNNSAFYLITTMFSKSLAKTASQALSDRKMPIPIRRWLQAASLTTLAAAQMLANTVFYTVF